MNQNILRFLYTIGVALIGFIAGRIFERARIVRQLEETKKQIIILSNKSSKIEDKFRKLLYACALYKLAIEKALKNDKEKIQNIVNEFDPINEILKENTNLLERLFIQLLIIPKKWEIRNMDEDELDE